MLAPPTGLVLLCLEWLVSNESIGAQHGGAVEQMYAKFKLALDDAVGYDFPLHRYSTFQDAPSLYKACWPRPMPNARRRGGIK